MKKFAVSLFIDYSSELKTYIVMAKSDKDIVTKGGWPTSKLMEALPLNGVDPESIYVDCVCIDNDEMPSPYTIKY